MPYQVGPARPGTRQSAYAAARTISVAAALLLVVFLVIGRSRAAFSGSTTNATNHVSTGSVTLGDNDSGTAMFDNVTDLVPGNSVTRCITVTYSGSSNPGNVKLYGALASQTNNLASNVNISIDQGTWSGAADTYPGCTNFSGSALQGATSVAALTSTNTSYNNGLTTWNPAGAGEYRVFRVTLSVQSGALESSDLTFSLTWEVQS
jgi:hypothetical protein